MNWSSPGSHLFSTATERLPSIQALCRVCSQTQGHSNHCPYLVQDARYLINLLNCMIHCCWRQWRSGPWLCWHPLWCRLQNRAKFRKSSKVVLLILRSWVWQNNDWIVIINWFTLSLWAKIMIHSWVSYCGCLGEGSEACFLSRDLCWKKKFMRSL